MDTPKTTATPYPAAPATEGVGSLLSATWHSMRAQGLHLVAAWLVFGVVAGCANILTTAQPDSEALVGLIGALINMGTMAYITTTTLVHLSQQAAGELSLTTLARYLVMAFVSGILVMLGFIALIIPGIILSVYWWLIGPVLVAEPRWWSALGASYRLVRGRWWRTLWLVVVTSLIGVLAAILLIAAVAATTTLVGADNPVIISLISGLGTVGIYIYMATCSTVLYALRRNQAAALETPAA